jgi:beta-xylosidase
MKNYVILFLALLFSTVIVSCDSSGDNNSLPKEGAKNPVIYADVPDMSMIRVGNAYYMSSTTMHMSPGVPIMKSTDLINWKIINYAYDTLANIDELNLENGKNAYSFGSWASSLRYKNGIFYVSTFSYSTWKTYIYFTNDIEKGIWKKTEFSPLLYDNSLFFDDDGKIYVIHGAKKIMIVELKSDFSGVKEGSEKVLIEDASIAAGSNGGNPEGNQLFKYNNKYYLFNITWPANSMRSVIVHRADKIDGPYTGRLVLQDKGVAQGGIIDTPDGDWFAYLFKDNGAIGRIPYYVPVTWKEDWPVLGVNGKVPESLALPPNTSLIPGIVNSDEFTRNDSDRTLPLVWQWNHNPVNSLWSVTSRKGYLRLTTGRIDTSILNARNTLTQRTIGPECTGSTVVDISNMKEGDIAGLTLFQKKYSYVGVKFLNGKKNIVMVSSSIDSDSPVEEGSVAVTGNSVQFKVTCDFKNDSDLAQFYYKQEGQSSWQPIGSPFKMQYSIAHFVGYRFGLFNFATKNTGGYVDFDYFHIEDNI